MSDAKDDRPAENLSFAAANLVKPGLSSKRQQSEPPLNRNVFPPTPPPESDRSASGSSSGQLSRGASVRNGVKPVPAKLNIEKALPPQRYEVRDEQPARRPAPARAASESRGPTVRREESRRRDPRDPPPPARRRMSDEEEEDEYPGELYDMYRNSRGSKGRNRPQPRYIEEEDEDGSDYEDDQFDENDFEMVPNRPAAPRSRAPSSSGRGSSRRPDIRKVRVKVHASEDTRYIMVGTAIEFPDLVDKIREKFVLRKRFKLKIRDDDMPDGDMITMGDQDDLEMAIMSVKTNARRDRVEMGKMDVSIPVRRTQLHTNVVQIWVQELS